MDASDRGIRDVLSQISANGEEHSVSYYSRKLLPREECYTTVEKECLAIKLSTNAFHIYLLGHHFTVQTDHRALEWMHQMKDGNPRLARWNLALQQFNFTVQGGITKTLAVYLMGLSVRQSSLSLKKGGRVWGTRVNTLQI